MSEKNRERVCKKCGKIIVGSGASDLCESCSRKGVGTGVKITGIVLTIGLTIKQVVLPIIKKMTKA